VCGIVGYVGRRPAAPILLAGLRKLEYRGYDSAGMSVLADGRIESLRAVGPLDQLEGRLNGASAVASSQATVGIGHTRWATHGRVTEENAHPHYDTEDRVHVVVNGIVENYMTLKSRLRQEGSVFTSETDAEVISHLVAQHRRREGDLLLAVQAAYRELQGHFAFVALGVDDPELLVGARRECPLVVGRGQGEQFVASAVPAFLGDTRETQYIENGELVVLRPGDVTITTAEGVVRARPVERIDWDAETAEKGGYETFMLKEIHEQADALAETISDRTASETRVELDDAGALDERLLADVQRIVIVACGTSYHAGLIGAYAIERWARLPVTCDVASEYRYRDPVVGPRDLVIGITQSGETADTLAAMRLARERGATVLTITNVMGSQATRDADGVLFTRAGLEVGVAATKTFTCQVAVMYLLALRLGELRGTLAPQELASLVHGLRALPHAVDTLLEDLDAVVDPIAERFWQSPFFLYIGRHVGLSVALEGALKLKEISYISTDAYAAGEMKHGPIALLDEQTPVVCVATDSPLLEKVISNVQEVRARGAHVIAVTTVGDERAPPHVDAAIPVPAADWMLQPILAVIPLQMLAYRIARRRGLNVDQPRNLAKTVTVE
jgi:glucosamine--fructose-6-phosphate aminotransferase (isomerizing)